MEKLFTYGTFQHPYVQEKILGRVIQGREGVLENFAVNCALEYYDLTECEGSSVKGMVLDLTEEELNRADIWENVPLYSRRHFPVRTEQGLEEATVYMMTERPKEFCKLEISGTYSCVSEENLKKEIDACVDVHPELQMNKRE